MASRNFPPSFWNSNYVPPAPAPAHHQVPDLYTTDTGYTADPWHAAHYGSYAHAAHAHAAHAHAYHHNMAQYGSLLRLPQQYGHTSHRLHHDQQTAHAAALESAAAYTSYPTMAGECGASTHPSLKLFPSRNHSSFPAKVALNRAAPWKIPNYPRLPPIRI
ncbi:hypothetical protein ZHAS_00006652 [Anopheles sinensis]|uniref:Uncharacterized protein n=1 Tax=Anopheles sinensis TaxID=74873 RepID=A0A084VMV4_ANOSI|nr:hypothetical protein ZHAS_00006652 [Anopheles sinensis]